MRAALLEQVARLEPGAAPNPDGGALTIEWTQGTLTVLPAPPRP